MTHQLLTNYCAVLTTNYPCETLSTEELEMLPGVMDKLEQHLQAALLWLSQVLLERSD